EVEAADLEVPGVLGALLHRLEDILFDVDAQRREGLALLLQDGAAPLARRGQLDGLRELLTLDLDADRHASRGLGGARAGLGLDRDPDLGGPQAPLVEGELVPVLVGPRGR